MKLAIVGPVYPYRGGIAHYTTMFYRALRERGHSVLMVSFKRQYPQLLFPGRSDRDPSEEPLRIEDARYWIDSLNPFTWLIAFYRIYRYQPDAMVLSWWTTFWSPVWFVFGLLNRLSMQKALIYICHNVLPHESQWWDCWLARLTLRWGTQFIVQSEMEKKRLMDLMSGVAATVVPHPIYDMFAGKRIPKHEARRQLGLSLEVPVLLFFGIVREYKGLRDLLVALPAIRTRLGKVILLVAGEFWDNKSDYLELIEQLGISDLVIIEDRYIPNEKVPIYFSAADVFVAPYHRVTGSGALQMAMGFGMPVVTTVSEELLENDKNDKLVRFLASPVDPLSLSEEIVRCYATANNSSQVTGIPQTDKKSTWVKLVQTIEQLSPEGGSR